MLIWFIEIPIALIFAAFVFMLAAGLVLARFVADACVAVSAVLFVAMLISFFVSVALQHISVEKMRKCDKITLAFAVGSSAIFLLGFIIRLIMPNM